MVLYIRIFFVYWQVLLFDVIMIIGGVGMLKINNKSFDKIKCFIDFDPYEGRVDGKKRRVRHYILFLKRMNLSLV